MRKFLIIGLIAVTTMSFVGCIGTDKDKGNESQQTNSGQEQKPGDSASDENKEKDKNKDENKEKDDNKDKDKTEDTNIDKNEKPNSNDKVQIEKDDKTERTFKIATKDVDYKVVKGKDIKTVGLGVADNIKKILSDVSKEYFDGKKIELKDIETVNNKKIAVINLAGDKDYWNQRMQGSVGGEITEYTLIENVLQKEYKGYWIDGVKFTLDGKQLQGSQHAEKLGQVTYR